MPTTLELPRVVHGAAVPNWPVARFTVAGYQRLTEIGVFHEDDKVELLEGWIVPKMPKNPLHDGTIDLLDGLLSDVLPAGWHTRVQNSLVTSDSVPEPDITVVCGERGAYRGKHPTGRDAALVIEVAESSVALDRKKAAIYARAGISEYWIVNLEDWQLERMTQPLPDGTFANTEILYAADAVPLTIAGAVIASLPLGELLTPPQ
jgi:Uma2 family endonuclease